MRMFFSCDMPCQAGCTYCFSKWDGLYVKQPLFNHEDLGVGEVILYPCCDGDFFDHMKLISRIKTYAENHEKVYVSISSKCKPSKEDFSQLLVLHDWLIKANKGFVKFAITVSNLSMIREIEPGTMTYGERLALADSLSALDVPLSLTIKPVLPFISAEEYYTIIKDFSRYTKKVLLGGLYINRQSDFYMQYIDGKYSSVKREVAWLIDHPTWDYVEDISLMKKIKQLAAQINVHVFDTDSAVVQSFVEELSDR